MHPGFVKCSWKYCPVLVFVDIVVKGSLCEATLWASILARRMLPTDNTSFSKTCFGILFHGDAIWSWFLGQEKINKQGHVMVGKFSIKPGPLSAAHFSWASCWAVHFGMQISFFPLPCLICRLALKLKVSERCSPLCAALLAGFACLHHDSASVPGGDCSATDLRRGEWAQRHLLEDDGAKAKNAGQPGPPTASERSRVRLSPLPTPYLVNIDSNHK